MAKKRAKSDASPTQQGKTRFELRFDTPLYEHIRAVATAADVSINQLMEGISRWAIELAVPGAPRPDSDYRPGHDIERDHRDGCVFFAQAATDRSKTTFHQVYFVLDFSPRAALRTLNDYFPPAPPDDDN